MEYTGLVQKYPVNRPLRDEERALQLRQAQRLEIETSSQLCVIRMDSTFMEIVDQYFSWKGMVTVIPVAGGSMALWTYLNMLHFSAVTPGRMETDWPWLLGMGLGLFAFLGFLYWAARFECFRYTHYPIRFNRQTRMVHVFRVDGTVLSVPWDKVFFCLGRLYQARFWSIQGHVLADDGITVLETFSLSIFGYGERDREVLKHVWEYVRRYMEEGPAYLSDRMKAVLPIADARESFMFGLHRTMSAESLLLVPVYLFIYPFRWIAMHTSKIPRWPQAIEAQCRSEPGDPYLRDASMNPK
jgi:hypothetical protein